ncbi:MAG: glycosyltransferase family 2 protein [Eubacterium sp.]|nr:glycosyltransferase family 2 protein [Eubacterium sp.]
MFFSVIVPVYNVEKYLEQCVESILSQTFTDYELILVDDCSTDNSGKLCDRYPDAVVIHKEKNGGQAEARNDGLEICKGEYVFFIDSDDFLMDVDAFEKMYRRIKESKCDVLLLNYKKYYESKDLYRPAIVGGMRNDMSIDALIQFNAYKSLLGNKVVKRDLLYTRNVRFPTGIKSEDLIWSFELLLYASNIVALQDEVYAYRQRDGSDSFVYVREDQKKRKGIADTLYSINYCLHDIDISKGNKYLLYSYLAYEYSWLIGAVYPFWDSYRVEVRKLRFLFRYRASNKVKKVWILYRLFGLRMASYVCCKYLQKKANERK